MNIGSNASQDGDLEKLQASELVEWAVCSFGSNVALASSFGANSAAILHMCTQIKPDMLVITIDTGFLFPETVAFRDETARRLNLNLHIVRPETARDEFLTKHGKVWRHKPDECCALNKIVPFQESKRRLGLESWITGIHQAATGPRRHIPIISEDRQGLTKICPIARWSLQEVEEYLNRHDLPRHPLRQAGYLSIGCHPEEGYCTAKVKAGEDQRSGRWPGFERSECGLHDFGREDTGSDNGQSRHEDSQSGQRSAEAGPPGERGSLLRSEDKTCRRPERK